MPTAQVLGFEPLERLRRYLAGKREKHALSLKYYYGPQFAGFYHKHEKGQPRMSKSSTSTCVVSLIRAAKWVDGPWKDSTVETLRIFLTEPWQSAGLGADNPFTVAFVLEAADALLSFTDAPLEPTLLQEVGRGELILKKEVCTGSVSLQGYPPSAYLTQLVTRVLAARCEVAEPLRSRILDWSWQELNNQLALLQAKSKNADVFQLGYAIVLVSDIGDPGEATPEESLILLTALGVFFAQQLPDGSWPRSRPLFHGSYCFCSNDDPKKKKKKKI